MTFIYLISKFSNAFTNYFGIVPNEPIKIGIIVTIMFHCFLVLKQGLDINLFSFCFSFILWSAETAKSTLR